MVPNAPFVKPTLVLYPTSLTITASNGSRARAARRSEPLTRHDTQHAGAGRARQHDGIGLQAGGAVGAASSHPLLSISHVLAVYGFALVLFTAGVAGLWGLYVG
jgi:hypothetical protein